MKVPMQCRCRIDASSSSASFVDISRADSDRLSSNVPGSATARSASKSLSKILSNRNRRAATDWTECLYWVLVMVMPTSSQRTLLSWGALGRSWRLALRDALSFSADRPVLELAISLTGVVATTHVFIAKTPRSRRWLAAVSRHIGEDMSSCTCHWPQRRTYPELTRSRSHVAQRHRVGTVGQPAGALHWRGPAQRTHQQSREPVYTGKWICASFRLQPALHAPQDAKDESWIRGRRSGWSPSCATPAGKRSRKFPVFTSVQIIFLPFRWPIKAIGHSVIGMSTYGRPKNQPKG